MIKLPKFAKPPVSEVAFSVTFSPLEKWRSAHAGVYWAGINEKYPATEVHGPLPSQIETFDADSNLKTTQTVQIQFPTPESQRYWFLTDPPVRLVQVQRDRFVFNWRLVKGDEKYPGYDNDIRPEFEAEWRGFTQFLSKQNIGVPNVLQCDVTYVNDLVRGQHWQNMQDALALLSFWCSKGTEQFLPQPETGNFSGSYLIGTEGRLHFLVQRALRAIDGKEIVQMQLTGRSNPKSGSTDDVMSCVDVLHEWIVRGFTDMTSKKAHEIWERVQ